MISRFRHALFMIAMFLIPAVSAQAVHGQSHPGPHLHALDPIIEQLQSKGHFPGIAVAVMRDGKPVHVGTYGQADLEQGTPVTTSSVFELASLTKQMTALAVMTLVDQGKLSLDDHLTSFIDDAPEAWSPITIDALLSHMAGLDHRFEQTVDGVLLTDYTTSDMLASAMKTPMLSTPGTDWAYSDQGYFLLGRIIEKVTGRSYADYMRETFFRPLGMGQTRLLDQASIVPHRAQGYAWMNGEIQRNRRVWQFGLASHFGVTSTLQDMMAWETELTHPKRIDAKALRATWPIQREFDSGKSCDRWGYARGWSTHVVDGRRILTHGGYSGTAYLRAVDDKVSVIVLTNREDTEEAISPMAIAWAMAHAVEPAIPEQSLRCWE